MEEIVLCNDLVASSLLNHFYTTLKEREKKEDLLAHEVDFIRKLETAFSENKTFDEAQSQALLTEAYTILDNKASWKKDNKSLYEALEKVLLINEENDLIHKHFEQLEDVITSAMSLDFSKKASITDFNTDKRNVLDYISVTLNMLIEKFETSVVSGKAINAISPLLKDTAIVVVDEDGNIRFTNNVFEELLSLDLGDLKGKLVTELIENADFINKPLHTWLTFRDEPVILKDFNGNKIQFLFSSYNTNNTDDEINEYVLVFRLKKSSTEERVFDITLDSHDRIAPVNQILGASNYLKNVLNEKDKYMFAEIIYNNALMVKEQAESTMKSLSIGYAEGIEPVNFHALVDSITKLYGDRNTVFDIEISLQVEFYSIPRLVKSLFMNLISNSVKYGKINKKNVISVYVREYGNKEGVLVDIKDTGIGISEEDQKRIFDSGYRATTQEEGSGKGLYLVNGIVERLNGKISLESVPDEGTHFTIKLPAFKQS